MYSTVLMTEDPRLSGFLLFLTIILIGVNTYFLVQWTYLFLVSLNIKNKYFKIFVAILGMILWKNGWNTTKTYTRQLEESEVREKHMEKTATKIPQKRQKTKSKRRKRTKKGQSKLV